MRVGKVGAAQEMSNEGNDRERAGERAWKGLR